MNTLRIGLLNIEPVLASELPVLLVFGGTWDLHSRIWFDALKRIADKYDGHIITGIVDYEYAPDIFFDFSVSELPTMIFFEDGKPIMRETKYTGSLDIDRFIHKFYGAVYEEPWPNRRINSKF